MIVTVAGTKENRSQNSPASCLVSKRDTIKPVTEFELQSCTSHCAKVLCSEIRRSKYQRDKRVNINVSIELHTMRSENVILSPLLFPCTPLCVTQMFTYVMLILVRMAKAKGLRA